jgi:hypothetical protein
MTAVTPPVRRWEFRLTPHPAPNGRHPLPEGERVIPRCAPCRLISEPSRAAPFPLPRHIRKRIWLFFCGRLAKAGLLGEGQSEGTFNIASEDIGGIKCR